MSISPSTLLSLPVITTGTESGLWGNIVNNGLTQYLDIAIAGQLPITITTTDVTLTNTAGTDSVTNIDATTAQYAILNITGAKTAARNLNLPASSREYTINNAGTGGFLLTVRGVTPTTGVTLVDGEKAIVAWSGTDYVKIASSVSATSSVQPITASVGSSALTATLNPTILDFRSATLTSGSVATRVISTAISVVVPSTATLGTTSAVQSDIMVLAIDNAGTVELAVVNNAGTADLSETGVISTTAISAGATSANVVYSTTARTSVAYRVVGMIRSTQATAGTWATTPSLLQGLGGRALVSNQYAGVAATVFTANGTFTIPTGITRIKMTIVGGGGGGGTGSGGCCGRPGSGGGGGGAAIKWLTVIPGRTLDVTVGAAGAASGSGGISQVATGTSGTPQSITTVQASGGSPGATNGLGGTGGIGSAGDLNIGGNAGNSSGSATTISATGGGSIFGGGGAGGAVGRAYGGGGGGGAGGAGSAGAAGVVFIEY